MSTNEISIKRERSPTPVENKNDCKERGRNPKNARMDRNGTADSSHGKRLSKKAPPERRIFVSNIAFDAKWQDIKDMFRDEVGDVTYVELFRDEKGESRGCGVLEFSSADLVKKAVDKMHRFEFKGRKLVVKEDFDNERDKHGNILTEKKKREQRERGSDKRDHNRERGRARDRSQSIPRDSYGSGENVWHGGETYGLSPQFLSSLDIEGPLHTRLFVANLAYSVDEKKLREVFRLAGRVVTAELNRENDGRSRGHGIVEFDHPVEAVQAISMLKDQSLFDRKIAVRFDKQPSQPQELDVYPIRLPEGLAGVGMGLGPDGNPLKDVAKNIQMTKNGTNFIQGPQPIQKLNINPPVVGNFGNLGQMQSLLSSSQPLGSGLYGASPAQNMVTQGDMSNQISMIANIVQQLQNGGKVQGFNTTTNNIVGTNGPNINRSDTTVESGSSLLHDGSINTPVNTNGINNNQIIKPEVPISQAPTKYNYDFGVNHLSNGNNTNQGYNTPQSNLDIKPSNMFGVAFAAPPYSSHQHSQINKGVHPSQSISISAASQENLSEHLTKAVVAHNNDPRLNYSTTGYSSNINISQSSNSTSQNTLPVNGGTMRSDSIMIRNLPPDCNWQILREGFAHCGEIKYAEMKERGSGLIRFVGEMDAQRAVSMMNNQTIAGRRIDVQLFSPKF